MSATRMPAWKLLFALARYAGLRIPSESPLATLEDVDFQGGRLRVPSPVFAGVFRIFPKSPCIKESGSGGRNTTRHFGG